MHTIRNRESRDIAWGVFFSSLLDSSAAISLWVCLTQALYSNTAPACVVEITVNGRLKTAPVRKAENSRPIPASSLASRPASRRSA